MEELEGLGPVVLQLSGWGSPDVLCDSLQRKGEERRTEGVALLNALLGGNGCREPPHTQNCGSAVTSIEIRQERRKV